MLVMAEFALLAMMYDVSEFGISRVSSRGFPSNGL